MNNCKNTSITYYQPADETEKTHAMNGLLWSFVFMGVFINGVYGEIYGVYTLPEYRRQGIATDLIKILIAQGKEIQLPYIQLEASSDGYQLYKNIGFIEADSNYIDMKLFLNHQNTFFYA